MELTESQPVATLLKRHRSTLLCAWKARVRSLSDLHDLDPPALADHIPSLIDELAETLENPGRYSALPSIAALHHTARFNAGITITHVVEEYKALRSCIAELAERDNVSIVDPSYRRLHEHLDDAIKGAVQAYFEQWHNEEKRRREQYLTFVVHDLRSPLAAIYNAIQLVDLEIKKVADGERARTIITAIRRNIERMQALIVKLLQEERNINTVANLNVSLQPVELHHVAESVTRTLAPLASGAGTEVINRVSHGTLANADGELIERVFQNLVANAIEHTPRGTVTIMAQPMNDERWECYVVDNGHGIPPQQRNQLLAPSQRSHKHGGRGLGLAVARQIIEAHGGSLHLESDVGKGTTVRFSVAAAAQPESLARC